MKSQVFTMSNLYCTNGGTLLVTVTIRTAYDIDKTVTGQG